ncbi:MAG: hypothetical protein MZU91_02920 [Desulfosudis oleivorans]|nr:hypothetical protein [Desulfosudis oleivorans]
MRAGPCTPDKLAHCHAEPRGGRVLQHQPGEPDPLYTLDPRVHRTGARIGDEAAGPRQFERLRDQGMPRAAGGVMHGSISWTSSTATTHAGKSLSGVRDYWDRGQGGHRISSGKRRGLWCWTREGRAMQRPHGEAPRASGDALQPLLRARVPRRTLARRSR